MRAVGGWRWEVEGVVGGTDVIDGRSAAVRGT